MGRQIPLDPNARADDPRRDAERDDGTREVAPDLAHRRLGIVNVAFYGTAGAGDRGWVLVDAGVIGTTRLIVEASEERFGEGSRPAAIVMTHGHFDHIGGLGSWRSGGTFRSTPTSWRGPTSTAPPPTRRPTRRWAAA